MPKYQFQKFLSFSKKKIKLFLSFMLLFSLVVFLKSHDVNTLASEEDRMCISVFFEGYNLPQTSTFNQEIQLIENIQKKILLVSDTHDGIPKNHTREFKDYLTYKSGMCYDKSRAIESVLRYFNFRVRHVMLLQVDPKLKSLYIFPKIIATHQTTEVFTKKGWLIVDNIKQWISIATDSLPVSVNELYSSNQIRYFNWNTELPHSIFNSHCIFFYGLYSRHGKFYPPYTFFPDVNYLELIQNLEILFKK